MNLARTRWMVTASGIVVLGAVAAGLLAIGGPDAGRRDRRDIARLEDLREIAAALTCHGEARAAPSEPASLLEIDPSCLAPDEARRLAERGIGAGPAITYPHSGQARVCAVFETRLAPARAAGWPPFDAETGCVIVRMDAG